MAEEQARDSSPEGNVLLSAAIGGRAKAVLQHPSITEIPAAEATLADIQEYTVRPAITKRLSRDIILLAVAALPVNAVERAAWQERLPEAKRRVGRRDADDVDVLALLSTQILVERQRFRRRGRRMAYHRGTADEVGVKP